MNELSEARPYRRLRRVIGAFALLALLANLAVWLLLRLGDSWPPATFVMFGPRWLTILPPLVVLLPAVGFRRRSLLPVIAALVVALGPVMGFQIPWGNFASEPGASSRLRVVTCNIHYGRTDPALVNKLVADVQPDILAFQEADHLKSSAFEKKDWHINRESGFVLASKHPITRAEILGDKSTGEQGSAIRYDLQTPAGNVTLISLHLASPREDLKNAVVGNLADLETNTELRTRQSEHLANQAGLLSGPLLLVGDFNTPSESAMFRRTWHGYSDAFAEAGWGWGYTFFNRWTRVRIDHILIGGGHASSAWVGSDLGSPHRPVIADVVWP